MIKNRPELLSSHDVVKMANVVVAQGKMGNNWNQRDQRFGNP
jgi:hypothetical protein